MSKFFRRSTLKSSKLLTVGTIVVLTINFIFVFLPLLSLTLAACAAPTDTLKTGFLNPPESAKPLTWWHWLDGNVTKEGITKDLQSMKRIGLGGSVTQGPAPNQPEVWLQAKVEKGLATFFFSLDGKTFTQLGDEVGLLYSTHTPNMVGFYTMNTAEKGHMDVDWFKYDYDGPKGK